MAAASPVAGAAAASPRPSRDFPLRRLRERATTTPGKLVLISILVVAGAVCFGVIAASAEHSRGQAVHNARFRTEPLMLDAAHLYGAFSDANATVATTLLIGGVEPLNRRRRYLSDLALVSQSLVALTAAADVSPGARPALATITTQLPIYSGLVETARADNGLQLPVGVSYMRTASLLLSQTILPAAQHLFATEARQLDSDYGSGSGASPVVVLAVSTAVALVLLALMQLFLARISHRVINIPALLATAIFAGVAIWALVGLAGEGSALSRAQRHGSDPLELLSATSVLFSRGQSDQSLALVNRGTDPQDQADFTAVMRALAPPGGLIGRVSALAHQTGTGPAVRRLELDFSTYRAQAARVASLQASGQPGPAAPPAAVHRLAALGEQVSDNLAGQTDAAQARFDHAAGSASSSLAGLSVLIPVLTALAALLTLFGLRERLKEYA